YHTILKRLTTKYGSIRVMEPAERELRTDLSPWVQTGTLTVIGHEGWLTTREQFREACLEKTSWRMDAFYRLVRKQHNVLMQNGKPIGGKFSLDADNRQPWTGQPPLPTPPRFIPDAITSEVGALIEEQFADHPGAIDLEALPATQAHADKLWSWARRECMHHFGPYEDAMTHTSTGLFHTRISPLLNIHRLLPRAVVDDVLKLEIPLSSKEGFLRQVLGWREFMHHVHVETDGFRKMPGRRTTVAKAPGDGGWSTATGRSWRPAKAQKTAEGGATPNYLRARRKVPPVFWEQESGLFCLDEVVRSVWTEGYSHHITRLMILSSLATMLDVTPRDLTDWFWCAYQDAYDWVVEPNVLGMGTFAVGDLMTTKPYISGAAYIDRMSDYCSQCRFNPKKNCPVTNLYWAFLSRNSEMLSSIHRMQPVMRGVKKRTSKQRQEDDRIFRKVSNLLRNGREITPDSLIP
ncbi:MAG: deoxyribodipyrimidine photolyase, partial [candidate division Zixibacteria bacterium]|nr:deoxyribodipyrimidine photolyase [candidate division Zixibacteria bacterium]